LALIALIAFDIFFLYFNWIGSAENQSWFDSVVELIFLCLIHSLWPQTH